MNTITGSSPHTRGTREGAFSIRHQDRFIPAYAGNASTRFRIGRMVSVHPRIRGERASVPCHQQVECGSSPHTRGTHFQ